MSRVALLLALLGVPLARAPSSTAPLASTPCTVKDLPPVDSTWQLVRASGFTFCVPGSWKPRGKVSDSLDAKRWEGDGISMSWDVGRPKTVALAGGWTKTTSSAISRRGMNPPAENPAGPRMVADTCPKPANDTFMADSVVVLIAQSSCGGTWMVTAWTTSPAVYLQGQAHNTVGALMMNAIVVTMHFPPHATAKDR
jgi:hypothetical protein